MIDWAIGWGRSRKTGVWDENGVLWNRSSPGKLVIREEPDVATVADLWEVGHRIHANTRTFTY